MSDNADFDVLGDAEQCDYCGQWPWSDKRIEALQARIEALEEELKYIGNYAIGAASRMDTDFAKSRFAEIEQRCKEALQEPTNYIVGVR